MEKFVAEVAEISDIKEGDNVIFRKYGDVKRISLDNKEYLVLNSEDIWE